LDSIRNKLYIYKNVYSAGTCTWNSVPAMFTKVDFKTMSPDLSKSIIHLAKDAGYKTYWISNQPKSTQWDFSVTAIAKQADHTFFFVDDRYGKIRFNYDEILLPKLISILKNRKQNEKILIVLHFRGSHMNFKDRYPPKFSKFKGNKNRIEKLLNQYDNSIFYTDYVLYNVIKIVNKYGGKFIFFSDHGLGNPKGPIPFKHDVREKPNIDSINVPLISNTDLNLDFIKPIDLFYFECIFSKWSKITANELNEKYCSKLNNERNILFFDTNLRLEKVKYSHNILCKH